MKTAQRIVIRNFLKDNSSHPTAKEIYIAVTRDRKFENLSMATVYNTLEYMKKKGLVRELAVPNFDYKRYDPNTSPHAHLVCTACGAIQDVMHPLHVGIPEEHRQGFTIHDSEVSFYGICRNCAPDQNGEKTELKK